MLKLRPWKYRPKLNYAKIVSMWKKWCLTILLLGIAHCGLAAVHITDIRVSPSESKTRVVFNLSGHVQFRRFALSNPDRVVLDFTNTQLATKLNEVDLSKTLIDGIRGGKISHANLRIVLDLKQKARSESHELPPKGKYGYRLVVDLFGHPASVTPSTVISAASHKAASYLTVVIDPGHGGKDPGATGRRGTHEKDVVLSIAKDLRADLQTVPGIKVCMTRNADYFVTLRGRLAIARKCHGDIFIAIHADAYRNFRARGASVFALSQRGATSEGARWLADSENKSERLGGNIDLSDKSHLLSSVLIDLSQTATINSSLVLGRGVIQRLSYVARMHSHKVDQAAFVVLKSPDIPSILIETGFLSNAAEENNLRTPSYRRKLANAIKQAVMMYVKEKLPQDVRVTKSITTKTYQVRRGDNLSMIAFKFGVTKPALIKANHLSSSKLQVGQQLKIPG